MSQSTFWEHRRVQIAEREADLPVKHHLREQAAASRARLVAGLAAIEEKWPGYDITQRAAAEKLLNTLLTTFIDAVANQHRPLPTTSICICVYCRTVTLPTGADNGFYRCPSAQCGAIWYHHRATKPNPLPLGFWDTALPGDQVAKKLLSEEQKDLPTGEGSDAA